MKENFKPKDCTSSGEGGKEQKRTGESRGGPTRPRVAALGVPWTYIGDAGYNAKRIMMICIRRRRRHCRRRLYRES